MLLIGDFSGQENEFRYKDLEAARLDYLECLNLARNRFDSASAFNLLGRISMKSKRYSEAVDYYSHILEFMPEQLDQDGFPFSNYALSQVLRITDADFSAPVIKFIEKWAGLLYQGTIPLNDNTPLLFRDVKEKCNNQYFALSNCQKTIDIIEKIQPWLDFINNYGKFLQNFIRLSIGNPATDDINGFCVVNNYNSTDSASLIMINTLMDNPEGIMIQKSVLFDHVLRDIAHDNFEFDYIVEISNPRVPVSDEKVLSHTSSLEPYFAGKMLTVELEKPELVTKLVRRRSWIYGVAILLLLLGMSLSILLINRDLRRKTGCRSPVRFCVECYT